MPCDETPTTTTTTISSTSIHQKYNNKRNIIKRRNVIEPNNRNKDALIVSIHPLSGKEFKFIFVVPNAYGKFE